MALSLAAALSSAAHATALPNGGNLPTGTHSFEANRVAGGHFVRAADGVDGATVAITGSNGLVIDDGKFSTAKPSNFTDGIELARGKSISLYNKETPTQSPGKPVPSYELYTAAEVKAIFASGDAARIAAAFTSSDAKHGAPAHLTEAHVLAALQAANATADARGKVAWKLSSAQGDVTINGGSFDFQSANQNLIAANVGKLVWNGGKLVSSGGGGETTLLGATGIELLAGSITSTGTIDCKPTAVMYDDRRQLNRDRWTLGKYLALASNGDIELGRLGQPGPVIHVSDGMLKIGVASAEAKSDAAPRVVHQLKLNSGSLTLQGHHRSTLLSLERTFDVVAVIKGGTLSIISSDSLVATPTESPSMWNMTTLLEGGTINLANSELIGPNSAIRGGTVNMTGRSSVSSPTGSLTISGGTINVGERAFIGAIRGDSKAQSPYPTTQGDLVISGGTLKFKVTAPAHGQELTVGTDIGGIYAGDNNPAKVSHLTLTITPGTVIELDTSALKKGSYTAAHFASVDPGDGSLQIAAPIKMGSPEQRYSATLDTAGLLTVVVH